MDNLITAANVARNKLDGRMIGISSMQVNQMIRDKKDFVFLDVDYVSRLRNSGEDRGADDSLEANAGWRATENIVIASEDNRYNVDEGRVEEINSRLTLNFWRPVNVWVGHKYYVDLVDPSEATHSIGLLGMDTAWD